MKKAHSKPLSKSIAPKRSVIKKFRAYSWYGGDSVGATEYLSYVIHEAGRLGLEISSIERHDRAPHTQTVLSDLLAWFSDQPNEAMSKLIDWRRLDIHRIGGRWKDGGDPRPRIEVTAHITKMNNLSVLWYPAGWHQAEFAWGKNAGHTMNMLASREFRVPPDFVWFQGDEEVSFQGRATNELMYVRGVGNLRPGPIDDANNHHDFNRDVLHAILVCAVRAAYEGLIRALDRSFDVTELDRFEFETREEPRDGGWSVERVVAWSLVSAKTDSSSVATVHPLKGS